MTADFECSIRGLADVDPKMSIERALVFIDAIRDRLAGLPRVDVGFSDGHETMELVAASGPWVKDRPPVQPKPEPYIPPEVPPRRLDPHNKDGVYIMNPGMLRNPPLTEDPNQHTLPKPQSGAG